MILAVDTTHEFGSLALVHRGEVRAERALYAPDGFGHLLFAQIEDLLARHGVVLGEITGFAAAAGPGSFTGVRIGLTCVKGLAEACDRPAIGVSNLQAVAWFGSTARRAVLLDARRGEIYGAMYDAACRIAVPETVTKLPAWLAALSEPPLEFVSPAIDVFAPALAASPYAAVPRVPSPRALAGAAGLLAEQRIAAGETGEPAALDANYVRRSDAELCWRDAAPQARSR